MSAIIDSKLSENVTYSTKFIVIKAIKILFKSLATIYILQLFSVEKEASVSIKYIFAGYPVWNTVLSLLQV